MKKIKSFVFALLFTFLLTACSSQNQTSTASANHMLTTEEFPLQISSASDVASPLPISSPELKESASLNESRLVEATGSESFLFNNISEYLIVDGSTACLSLMSKVMQCTTGISAQEAESSVFASKTTLAYYYLANKEADMLMVYEESTENIDQTKKLFQKKAIGLDALVFIVNKNNPIDNLTSNQARDIYMGRIKNWKDVGGEDVPIVAYQRNETSGSYVLLEKLVLDGIKPMKPPSLSVSDMDGIIEVLADYDNGEGAIGYSVYYFVHNMKKDPNIKMLSIDGIYPNDDTIQLETYPYTNPFYAVVRSDEALDRSSMNGYKHLTENNVSPMPAMFQNNKYD